MCQGRGLTSLPSTYSIIFKIRPTFGSRGLVLKLTGIHTTANRNTCRCVGCTHWNLAGLFQVSRLQAVSVRCGARKYVAGFYFTPKLTCNKKKNIFTNRFWQWNRDVWGKKVIFPWKMWLVHQILLQKIPSSGCWRAGFTEVDYWAPNSGSLKLAWKTQVGKEKRQISKKHSSLKKNIKQPTKPKTATKKSSTKLKNQAPSRTPKL